MDSNKDEAERCLAIAKRALEAGDISKCQRFVSKSLQLFPLPQAEAMQEVLRRSSSAAANDGPTTSEGSPRSSPQTAAADEEKDGETSVPQPTARATSSSSEGMGNGTASGGRGGGGVGGGPGASSSGGGVSAGEGMRQRAASGRSADGAGSSGGGAESIPRSDSFTSEQIELVRRLRVKTCYYEILEVSRECTEDDVKKSYRKLALKLHPDKNKAPGAEEAFKKVSRAFVCLSDKDKRAAYDRYGSEDPQQAMLRRQPTARRTHSGMNGNIYFDDLDPNELFNAFFGVNAGHGSPFRVYTHGDDIRRQMYQRQHPNVRVQEFSLPSLFQFIPLVLILFLILFSSTPRDPPYRLAEDRVYSVEMRTEEKSIPYYVKSQQAIDEQFPPGSRTRLKLEYSVIRDYREILEQRCYHERVQQQRLYSYGKAAQARGMRMPYCEQLTTIFQYG